MDVTPTANVANTATNGTVATQPAQTSETPNNTRQALPTTENNTAVETPPNNNFALPDSYKEKGWAKNIKSLDDLLKAHDNAQSLIGKKTIGIPEDWNDEKTREDFLSKVRPKTADDYQIDAKPEVKELCHKYGLSQYQAENIAKGLQEVTAVEFSKDGFEKEISGIFGNDKETAAKSAQYIKQVLGDKASALDTFTNSQLGVIYQLAKQGLNSLPQEGSGNLQSQNAVNVREPSVILKELQALDNQPNGWTKKPALLEELKKSQQFNKRS